MSSLIPFLDTIKAAAAAARAINNIDIQQKLIDVQAQAMEFVEENRSLNEKVAELEERLKVKESLRFHDNFYWTGEGDGEDGPFCSSCWDTGAKLVRLHGFNDNRHYGCPGCAIVRTRDGEPESNHAVLKRFHMDRAMGRQSGGRR